MFKTALIALASLTATRQDRPSEPIRWQPLEVMDLLGQKIPAESGRLLVHQRHEDPDSALIELALVRLKSRSTAPGPPIVYLHGGPGGSATPAARDREAVSNWTPFLALGDVILLDQRGTGASRPSMQWPVPGGPPLDVFSDQRAMARFFTDASTRAAKALREQGIDPDAYNTEESADDVNDLRLALGANRLRLIGFSYGTHLGLSIIRRHGAFIDSAVLIGIEGPNHTEKLPSTFDTQFRKIALMASHDPAVSKQVPDLVALFERVLQKLEAKPIMVTIAHPATRQPVQVPVGKFGLQFLLMIDLGDRSDFIVFPRLLASIEQGDASLLQWFVTKRMNQLSVLNALLFTMDVVSGATEDRRRRIAAEAQSSLFGDAMILHYPELDQIWDVTDLGEAFRAPIVTSVRTLFVSGTVDNNTPPFQAEELRWGFTDAQHLIIDYAGHEDWQHIPAVLTAMRQFLAGEALPSLRVALPPPRFVPLEGFDPSATHPSVPRG